MCIHLKMVACGHTAWLVDRTNDRKHSFGPASFEKRKVIVSHDLATVSVERTNYWSGEVWSTLNSDRDWLLSNVITVHSAHTTKSTQWRHLAIICNSTINQTRTTDHTRVLRLHHCYVTVMPCLHLILFWHHNNIFDQNNYQDYYVRNDKITYFFKPITLVMLYDVWSLAGPGLDMGDTNTMSGSTTRLDRPSPHLAPPNGVNKRDASLKRRSGIGFIGARVVFLD